MASKQITRRDFIKTTAAGALATGLGAPFIVPQRSYGASAKKEPEDSSVGTLRPGLRQMVQREICQGMG